jgi:hypothetical protein
VTPAAPDASRDAGPPGASTVRAAAAVPVAELAALRVGVRHASLEHAPYRLLVGHFQGLPFSGAESQLNRRSEGRLERLLLTHQYPQRLGEIAILDPVDEAPPQGAVVLGLGPSGELTSLQLRDVVTRALLRVALSELDRRLASPQPIGREWTPLGVSSVMVGTSTGGSLSVEASVRALIDGTIAANGRLTRLRVPVEGTTLLATDIVAIETLEFIERFEDRVDLIVGVLARLASTEGRSGGPVDSVRQPVVYDLQPGTGEGRSTARSPIDAAEDVWRRVDIRAVHPQPDADTIQLEFTSIGRLARAERLVGLAERAILDPLVAGAIEHDADPDISGTLYELLVPHVLKGELGAGEHLHLLVDQWTADYPWELMRPRPDEQDQDRPLALRVGVLRQFRETENVRFDVQRATGHQALVIGNPPAGPQAQLPGAMREARTAAGRLRDAGWNVTALIWDAAGKPAGVGTDAGAPATGAPEGIGAPVAPIRALHQLLNGDWRVVHFAAHGHLTGDDASTGIILGDLRLTANVFSKMSIVPDLVVVNACHLGRVLTGANRVAASVGRALLQLGVRAVVVAGWAVNDVAAEAFAAALYTSLLQGADFGRAVSEARTAAWSSRPQSLTWGAYQCYGDPGFCLTTKSVRTSRPVAHTLGELRRRIQLLHARASDQGRSMLSDREDATDGLRRELRQLETETRALGSAPEALTDLAAVWAALFDIRAAIARYRVGVARGGSGVTVGAIEQLGNLLSVRAQQLHRHGLETAARGHSARAETWLRRAVELGPTGERLALLGGFHKRQATMTAGSDRDRHLVEAARCFAEAQRIEPAPYHDLNARQLAALARLHGLEVGPSGGPRTDERDATDRAATGREATHRDADAHRRRPTTAPDFWTRAAIGDRLLTDLVVSAAPRDDQAGDHAPGPEPPTGPIVDAYRAAFRLRSSARERDSVVAHVRDLQELAPAGSALAASLQKVRDDLASWTCHDPHPRTGPGPAP